MQSSREKDCASPSNHFLIIVVVTVNLNLAYTGNPTDLCKCHGPVDCRLLVVLAEIVYIYFLNVSRLFFQLLKNRQLPLSNQWLALNVYLFHVSDC